MDKLPNAEFVEAMRAEFLQGESATWKPMLSALDRLEALEKENKALHSGWDNAIEVNKHRIEQRDARIAALEAELLEQAKEAK